MISKGLELHGEKGKLDVGSTNNRITEGEVINARAELREFNCLPEIESANQSFPEEEKIEESARLGSEDTRKSSRASEISQN